MGASRFAGGLCFRSEKSASRDKRTEFQPLRIENGYKF